MKHIILKVVKSKHIFCAPAYIDCILGASASAYTGYKNTRNDPMLLNVSSTMLNGFSGFLIGGFFGGIWPITIVLICGREYYIRKSKNQSS